MMALDVFMKRNDYRQLVEREESPRSAVKTLTEEDAAILFGLGNVEPIEYERCADEIFG